jgi:hypothetical protein
MTGRRNALLVLGLLAQGCGAKALPPAAAALPDAASSPADALAADLPAFLGDAPVTDAGTPEVAADRPTDRPACAWRGAESCWNGLDDDCNGATDCADPACGAAAICVPAAAHPVGTAVAATDACPTGFGGPPLLLGADLAAPPCTGCACERARVVCAAHIHAWGRDDFDACDAAAPGEGGIGSYFIATGQPCDNPFGSPPVETDMPAGLRLGPVSIVAYGRCKPHGVATLPPATFRTALRFCPLDPKAGGCTEGHACAPGPASGRRLCQLLPGDVTCPAGTAREGGVWHDGIDDQRRCAACTCGVASGGGCADVRVRVGTEDCEASNQFEILPGMKRCLRNIQLYAPGVRLIGEPTKGTCPPAVETTGAATPTGAHTLCCAS